MSLRWSPPGSTFDPTALGQFHLLAELLAAGLVVKQRFDGHQPREGSTGLRAAWSAVELRPNWAAGIDYDYLFRTALWIGSESA